MAPMAQAPLLASKLIKTVNTFSHEKCVIGFDISVLQPVSVMKIIFPVTVKLLNYWLGNY